VRFDDGRSDGAISPDGRVCGTYVHGLFAGDEARAAWLATLGVSPAPLSYDSTVENALDVLAEHIERHADVDRLLTLAQ
jgi:adenosylcobyric acid synthase